MEYPIKKVGLPNFQLIERSLKENDIFEDDVIMVVLHKLTDPVKEIFEISLSAKKKKTDLAFRIETRIALEQHSSEGHQYPHLQINNFASNEELMKKGILRIVLLVSSKEELEECCNGFVYNISNILDLIQETFNVTNDLKEFFFNLEPLTDLKKFDNKLQDFIYLSFKMNKLEYEGGEIELINFKGKKKDPLFDTSDFFKILQILLQLRFLNPVLLEPLLKLILEDPQIKNQCPKLSLIECKQELLQKSSSDLKYYNRVKFIKEFRSNLS